MLNLDECCAVIFDMDGLVLDTESTYFIAWQQTAKLMGYGLSDVLCSSLSGLSYKDVCQRLQGWFGVGFNQHTFNQISDEIWRKYVGINGINTMPGFTGLLNYLVKQHIPYCLATNSHKQGAHECLNYAGLENVFSVIVTCDDVLLEKPAPDIFLKAAELLKVPINQCIVLEDSYTGILAGVNAGARTVYVPSRTPSDRRAAKLSDLVLGDLEQFYTVLMNANL
ncbi:MAG: HAD family phosphatase [Methylococcales bacterium]|nr:HAD family phosphatase [Methylococcales bacterium]